MLLLGFGHKARQGKDTAAAAVIDYYRKRGYPVRSAPFAGALRQETSQAIDQAGGILNLLRDGLSDGTAIPAWVTPETTPAVSDGFPFGKHPKLLQWWGTEYRRAQDPDYWVKRVEHQLAGFNGIAVISDLRFVNEFESVTNARGYTIQISRVNSDGTGFVAPDRDPYHVSETALNDANWDFFIKVKSGHPELLSSQAIMLTGYILRTHGVQR